MGGEISFTTSESDYLAAGRDIFLRSLRGRRGWRLVGATMACSAAGGAVLASVVEGAKPIPIVAYAVMCALISLTMAPILYVYCWATLPGRSRRLFRQNKALQHPVRYAWSADGLSYESSTGTVRLPWSDFHRWVDGRRSFAFLPTESMFYVIPKRVLTAAQAEDLRATAASSGLARM